MSCYCECSVCIALGSAAAICSLLTQFVYENGKDKVYNPYFSLIGLQLADQSHATRFTMQYALWDFLRSIGETTATGRKRAELMEEDEDDFDGTEVSETKLAHVARCYAWWIAKGVLSLNVLKVRGNMPLLPVSIH